MLHRTHLAIEELSERQKNEIEYHRTHALEHARVLEMPLDWSVLQKPSAQMVERVLANVCRNHCARPDGEKGIGRGLWIW